MNLELLQTVDQSYPEHNDGILDSGSEALTCAFNRRGTLLAVGCNDGRIAIWDFMTRGIARICSEHIHPITYLSWNRSGSKVISSSTDWNVFMWDIASGEIDQKFRFPSPIVKAQFHPKNWRVFLVCPMKNVPVLVQRDNNGDYKHTPLPTDGESELNIVASFDRRGDRVVTGSSKGKVLIIDTKTLKVLMSFKLTGTAIKSIEFARRGNTFLVNSADRVIRVFDIEDILKGEEDDVEALQRLQDLVNRTQWKKCSFSGDGEFIVAGSHRQHALYIWDKATGSLVKMLTGQKGETLLDVAWHPVRPVILSISNGVVNVWSQAFVELWSAYAPNFKELDENEEYCEREDEFDIEDEDSTLKKDGENDGDDVAVIDVMGVQPIPAFCSSDEDDEEPLDWLPMAPEIEDPEEPGWGQLEPTLNELPVTSGGDRKRPHAGQQDTSDDNPPQTKIAKTIDFDLPQTTPYNDASSKSEPIDSKSETAVNQTTTVVGSTDEPKDSEVEDKETVDIAEQGTKTEDGKQLVEASNKVDKNSSPRAPPSEDSSKDKNSLQTDSNDKACDEL